MHLIAVGRLRDGPEAALFDRYNARLRPRLTVTELPEARGAPAEIKRREGAALTEALPRQGFAVASISAAKPLTVLLFLIDWSNGWATTNRFAS
jgi:hypothetical protein